VLLRQRVRVGGLSLNSKTGSTVQTAGQDSAEGWSSIHTVSFRQLVSFDVSEAEVCLAKKAVMLRHQVRLTKVLLKDIQLYRQCG
jgi:hypothetical protein